MQSGDAPDTGAIVSALVDPAPPLSALDVMRSVAHELRQPLSSIESIAYYLTLIMPQADGKIHEQLFRIQELIEQSHWILSNGLRLASPGEIGPRDSGGKVDLEEVITESLSARTAVPRWHCTLDLAGELPPVQLNPDQATALVGALLMMFRQIATDVHPVTIRTRPVERGGVTLELLSSAPGYRSESAMGPGSAMGIEIARRIAETHGGTLEFAVEPEAVRARVFLR